MFAIIPLPLCRPEGPLRAHPHCNTARMLETGSSDEKRTLEQLALAEWSGSAEAELVSVNIEGDRAEVGLLVNGGYEYWTYYLRQEGAWRETVTGNGQVAGWNDPTSIRWGEAPDSPVSESP